MEVSILLFAARCTLICALERQRLLDFSKEFDVGLMDRVAMAFYTGAGPEVRWIAPDFAFILPV